MFIEFEKSYHSALKSHLAVKLWGRAVTERFFKLLDGFKNNREIEL